MSSAFLTVTPVNPAKNVTERRLHVFDNRPENNETIYLFNPGSTILEIPFEEAMSPGSCYLIDVNDVGESKASEAVALVFPPREPPPPPPATVPEQPTITKVTWETGSEDSQPSKSEGSFGGKKVVDCRIY